MKNFLLEVKKRAVIGIVGGSDLVKMQEQMGAGDGENIARRVWHSCHVIHGLPPYSDEDV